MNNKKLTKSKEDSVLSGVIGGVAEYTNTDSSLLRFFFIALFLFGFGGLLAIAYISAMFLIPDK